MTTGKPRAFKLDKVVESEVSCKQNRAYILFTTKVLLYQLDWMRLMSAVHCHRLATRIWCSKAKKRGECPRSFSLGNGYLAVLSLAFEVTSFFEALCFFTFLTATGAFSVFAAAGAVVLTGAAANAGASRPLSLLRSLLM